ncbi:hypothetical protein [Rhizobium sp. 2MFCol3.1]|uniref:hypothetical protein n=1 Tax=Rhizobium sp. 2MFCol3.1 TaxID=1246459 RepID=UPI0003757B27|nr:hypothetical protein [Rhizobium sp. 2MFCol3.1]
MASELDLIRQRRKEVEEEISLLNEKIIVKMKEMERLEIAWNVLAELTGGIKPSTSTHRIFDKGRALRQKRFRAKRKTMPEKILAGLALAEKDHKVGLRPKEIHRAIIASDDPDADIGRVNAVAWRMWKAGTIERDDQSRYSLPKTSNAVDPVLGEDEESTALEPSADGRLAGPGGGT